MAGFESPQDIQFKFNSVAYTVTSLSVTKSAGEFNVTDLSRKTTGTGTAAVCLSVYRPGALKSVEIKADLIGLATALPPQDDTYTLEISGGGTAAKGALWGEATVAQFTAACTSYQFTAQAGELIKGTATFKLSYD